MTTKSSHPKACLFRGAARKKNQTKSVRWAKPANEVPDMSLLGVVSRTPVHARATISKDACSFVVQEGSNGGPFLRTEQVLFLPRTRGRATGSSMPTISPHCLS